MQWGCSILRQCSPLWIHARSLLENVGYWVHENSNFMISRSFANAIIANAFLKGERCLNYWKSTVLSLGALYTAVRTLCIFFATHVSQEKMGRLWLCDAYSLAAMDRRIFEKDRCC